MVRKGASSILAAALAGGIGAMFAPCDAKVAYPWPTRTGEDGSLIDLEYPGTAVERLCSVLENVQNLTSLDGPWPEVRSKLLAAGGMKEDVSTSHSFNDFNHCDLTTMRESVSYEHNWDGQVKQISTRNQLGPFIKAESIKELGSGGSWSTCMIGCSSNPPRDVAHIQFKSRVAFKLVWVPPNFDSFVLLDDDGKELRRGFPTGGTLPAYEQRQANFDLVKGGQYEAAAKKAFQMML
mmetsp:Transcript_79194/g.164349  ORF Transcript_79194/g.164349 Transcript_79194/m.164349 type:complete len:237 (-) Transcript_79194:394-1104(-)